VTELAKFMERKIKLYLSMGEASKIYYGHFSSQNLPTGTNYPYPFYMQNKLNFLEFPAVLFLCI
jgi:hypothetical protein